MTPRIPKKATALGFQIYTNTNDFINSVNIVADGKLKAAFARVEQPQGEMNYRYFADNARSVDSPASFSTFENDDIGVDETFPSDPSAPKDTMSTAEKARENAKAEKPKPWYKEYVSSM